MSEQQNEQPSFEAVARSIVESIRNDLTTVTGSVESQHTTLVNSVEKRLQAMESRISSAVEQRGAHEADLLAAVKQSSEYTAKNAADAQAAVKSVANLPDQIGKALADSTGTLGNTVKQLQQQVQELADAKRAGDEQHRHHLAELQQSQAKYIADLRGDHAAQLSALREAVTGQARAVAEKWAEHDEAVAKQRAELVQLAAEARDAVKAATEAEAKAARAEESAERKEAEATERAEWAERAVQIMTLRGEHVVNQAEAEVQMKAKRRATLAALDAEEDQMTAKFDQEGEAIDRGINRFYPEMKERLATLTEEAEQDEPTSKTEKKGK